MNSDFVYIFEQKMEEHYRARMVQRTERYKDEDDECMPALEVECPVCKQSKQITQETYSTTDIFPNRSQVQVCSKECMRELMDNWLAGSPHLRSVAYQKIEEMSPSSHDARPKRGK